MFLASSWEGNAAARQRKSMIAINLPDIIGKQIYSPEPFAHAFAEQKLYEEKEQRQSKEPLELVFIIRVHFTFNLRLIQLIDPVEHTGKTQVGRRSLHINPPCFTGDGF